VAVALYLVVRHGQHFAALLPFAIILLCPLSHLFMHPTARVAGINMEGSATMTTTSASPRWIDPVHVVSLGWALTLTFIVLYVLCWLVGLVAPNLPLAHGWLLIFSTADPGSIRSFIEGVAASFLFAWASALLFGLTYNSLRLGEPQT
jgi:hypothetical protein